MPRRKLYTPDESQHTSSGAKKRPKPTIHGRLRPKAVKPKRSQRATGSKKQLPVQRRGKRAAIRRKLKR